MKDKVKRTNRHLSHWQDYVSLDEAIERLVHTEPGPIPTNQDRDKIRKRLESGEIMRTLNFNYEFINPVKDILDNIDDDVEL